MHLGGPIKHSGRDDKFVETRKNAPRVAMLSRVTF